MKKVFLVLLPAVLSLSSCMQKKIRGTGTQVTEPRNVTTFNAADIGGAIDATITIQEGATPSVQLIGYENLVKSIKTEIKDNTLSIHTEPGIELSSDQKVKAIITLPSITGLSLSGATDATIHGVLKGNNFSLELSGASEVLADNISVGSFSTEISGAGKVNINGGSTQIAKYELSGASVVKAFALVTDETSVELSGAGVANVNAQKKLNTHISGVGSIHYKGHPAITSEKSGIGALTDAN
jgi:hypothetical protein